MLSGLTIKLENGLHKCFDSKTANAGQANFTKYGKWFGWNGVAWCHIFVSWVAEQVGCAPLIPRTASCYGGRLYTVESNTSSASGEIANGGGVAAKSYA